MFIKTYVPSLRFQLEQCGITDGQQYVMQVLLFTFTLPLYRYFCFTRVINNMKRLVQQTRC